MRKPHDDQTGDGRGEGTGGSLSRRAILSGLAAVGGGGALAGGAAGAGLDVDAVRSLNTDDPARTSLERPASTGDALEGFHDVEVFGAMSANVVQSGRIDLSTCWERPGEDCRPSSDATSIDFGTIRPGDSGAATLRCTLEDNPAWVWLRTSCPDDSCGLERGVDVTVWYDRDCDGSRGREPIVAADGTELADVPLCTALSALHEGVLLDGNPESEGAGPLGGGETCCLGFEWDAGHFCGDDELEIDVELFARQRRHNPTPQNPWGSSCDVVCDFDCPVCNYQGISFVAFCIEEGELSSGDVSFRPYYDFEGETYRIDWQSDVALDWVVLYYGSRGGRYFENFDYDGQETSGSVQVNSPGHTYYDSRLRWEGDSDVTALGQCPRDPCPNVPTRLYGCGVRYNFDDGVWDEVCKQSCQGEEG